MSGPTDDAERIVFDGARLGFPQLHAYQFTLLEHAMSELSDTTTFFATVRATGARGEFAGDARLSSSRSGSEAAEIYVSAIEVAAAHRGKGVGSALVELGRWYWGEELAVTSAGPAGDTAAGQRLMRSIQRRLPAPLET